MLAIDRTRTPATHTKEDSRAGDIRVARERRDALGHGRTDAPLLYVLRNDLELNGAKYGEGSQGPTAAAVANAFAAATSRRMRDIPFTRERVKAILA